MPTSDSANAMRPTYSSHASRGKVKILVTYRNAEGVVSSTVTSVDDAETAAPIVEALNRITAIATEPLTKRDTRTIRPGWHPDDHLAALSDRDARGDLLEGNHSLWYEYVKTLLYQALADLDEVIQDVPAPVQTAIAAELAGAARGLREAVARRNGEEVVSQRLYDITGQSAYSWKARLPLDGGALELLEHQQAFTPDELEVAVAGLRLLCIAFLRTVNENATFIVENLMISDDPHGHQGQYLIDVLVPMPGEKSAQPTWEVDIRRRTSENDAEGELAVRCGRSTPPTVEEIVELLDRSGGRPEQLAVWAKTPDRETLDGTTFVVTERHDD